MIKGLIISMSGFSNSSRDIFGHGQHDNVSAGLFAIISEIITNSRFESISGLNSMWAQLTSIKFFIGFVSPAN